MRRSTTRGVFSLTLRTLCGSSRLGESSRASSSPEGDHHLSSLKDLASWPPEAGRPVPPLVAPLGHRFADELCLRACIRGRDCRKCAKADVASPAAGGGLRFRVYPNKTRLWVMRIVADRRARVLGRCGHSYRSHCRSGGRRWQREGG